MDGIRRGRFGGTRRRVDPQERPPRNAEIQLHHQSIRLVEDHLPGGGHLILPAALFHHPLVQAASTRLPDEQVLIEGDAKEAIECSRPQHAFRPDAETQVPHLGRSRRRAECLTQGPLHATDCSHRGARHPPAGSRSPGQGLGSDPEIGGARNVEAGLTPPAGEPFPTGIAQQRRVVGLFQIKDIVRHQPRPRWPAQPQDSSRIPRGHLRHHHGLIRPQFRRHGLPGSSQSARRLLQSEAPRPLRPSHLDLPGDRRIRRHLQGRRGGHHFQFIAHGPRRNSREFPRQRQLVPTRTRRRNRQKRPPREPRARQFSRDAGEAQRRRNRRNHHVPVDRSQDLIGLQGGDGDSVQSAVQGIDPALLILTVQEGNGLGIDRQAIHRRYPADRDQDDLSLRHQHVAGGSRLPIGRSGQEPDRTGLTLKLPDPGPIGVRMLEPRGSRELPPGPGFRPGRMGTPRIGLGGIEELQVCPQAGRRYQGQNSRQPSQGDQSSQEVHGVPRLTRNRVPRVNR
jgi:hypothetical protein